MALATCLVAAEPKPAKLTVVQNDKKAVAGELMQVTPADITVKPGAPKGTEPTPVVIPWKNVKSVSNGLTRQKVVDLWKTIRRERLCDTCHGDGATKCDTCKGSGVDPAQATPCDKCKGAGSVGKCLNKCVDGKSPCPETCLKASQFASLPVQPDGKKHKTFKNKDGSSLWWSEGHVGELVALENGVWVNKGKCPTCAGSSQVICPTCHGTAVRDCPACKGAGATGPACAACKGGKLECGTCSGTGLKAGDVPPAG